MGKPTGFLEYNRQVSAEEAPLQRIRHFHEFHKHLTRKEQQEQGARCMDCGVPFCQSGMKIAGMTSGCPLHNLVPEWNDLVCTGNWENAYYRLKKTNNFPEFTSRVCPALCEKACTCGIFGEAVSTKENEYAIVEYAYETGLADANPPKVRTGKRVAVVGSGPAGLAAADQLNRRGHNVTVFERSDRVGGLLMYGIPNMKLEKQVVERKVKVLEEEGISFQTNADVGAGIAAERLLEEFDRIIVCCGASAPRDMNVPGRDADGIYFAVDFLTGVTKSLLDSAFHDKKYVSVKGKSVVIIGGGDTGNDCVGTVIRLGAKSVTQIEMMPELPKERSDTNPWPQWPKVRKTDYGQEEAAALYGHDPRIYESTVKAFVKEENGSLMAVTIVKLKWEQDASGGRMVMKEVPGSEETIEAQVVLIAAGFTGAQSYIADAFNLERDERGNVKTDEGSFKTSVENVFTAGDMHTGQSLVVQAIAQGRACAQEVDRSLMG